MFRKISNIITRIRYKPLIKAVNKSKEHVKIMKVRFVLCAMLASILTMIVFSSGEMVKAAEVSKFASVKEYSSVDNGKFVTSAIPALTANQNFRELIGLNNDKAITTEMITKINAVLHKQNITGIPYEGDIEPGFENKGPSSAVPGYNVYTFKFLYVKQNSKGKDKLGIGSVNILSPPGAKCSEEDIFLYFKNNDYTIVDSETGKALIINSDVRRYYNNDGVLKEYDLGELTVGDRSVIAAIEDVFGDKNFFDVTSAMVRDDGTPLLDYSTMTAMIKPIYNNILLPIGCTLMGIYFCFAIYEEYMRQGELTIDNMVKHLFGIIIGVVFFIYALDWLMALWQAGDSLGSSFLDALSNRNPANSTGVGSSEIEGYKYSIIDYQILGPSVHDATFGESIGIIMHLAIPRLVNVISNLCVYIVLFSRILELVVRITIFPIAGADLIKGPSQSVGWKNIKKIFALALQYAFIILILYGVTVLSAGFTGQIETTNDVWDATWFQLSAIRVAGVALLFRSNQIANDIVGV